jgi:cytochrome P450
MKIGTVDPLEVAEVNLDAIDLMGPELYEHGDPHLVWAALRQRDPVHRHETTDGRVYWSLTRHADVSYALRDHSAFTAERGVLLGGVGTDDPAGGRQIAVTDGPRHRPLRDTLYRSLNKSLDAYEDKARDRIRRMIDSWPEGEPFDLAAGLLTFGMVIVGDLMQLPEADWPRLAQLCIVGACADKPRPAHIALFSYLQGEVNERKRNPSEDLIRTLMNLEIDGSNLTSADVVCNSYNVLLGTNVTMPQTAAATLLGLMESGGYREWARSGAATSPSGVDEAVRWCSPTNHFLRHTTRDVELAGGTIPAGEAVALWLSSANRDEALFADPYRFDIGRHPNQHLTFGAGVHYCVGYVMAKLSLKILFEEIIAAVEDFELAGPVEHLRSNLIAGHKHLPVTIRRRRGASGTDQRKESTDS